MTLRFKRIALVVFCLFIMIAMVKYNEFVDTKLWNVMILLVILIKFGHVFMKYKRRKELVIVSSIVCIIIVITVNYFYPMNVMNLLRDLEHERFCEFSVTKYIPNAPYFEDGELISDENKIDELKEYLKNTKIIRYEPRIFYDYDEKYVLVVSTLLKSKFIRFYKEGYITLDGRCYKIIKNGITEEYLLRFL